MSSLPVEHTDPINAKILSISEDLIAGFQRQPFHLIAEKSGVPLDTVIERIRAMQEAGIIRRVRQTLLSTKLAHGALVAWKTRSLFASVVIGMALVAAGRLITGT